MSRVSNNMFKRQFQKDKLSTASSGYRKFDRFKTGANKVSQIASPVGSQVVASSAQRSMVYQHSKKKAQQPLLNDTKSQKEEGQVRLYYLNKIKDKNKTNRFNEDLQSEYSHVLSTKSSQAQWRKMKYDNEYYSKGPQTPS